MLSSLDSPPPSLSQLSQAMEKGTVPSLSEAAFDPQDRAVLTIQIAAIIADLSQWHSASIALSQIPPLASLIIRAYPHMYVDDLRLFADQAKRGDFGKVYGAFAPSTLMDWLAEYWRRRSWILEEEAYAAHLSRKEAYDYPTGELSTSQITNLRHQLNL